MVKTTQDLIEEKRILEEAKKGMRKEKIKNAYEKTKKIASGTKRLFTPRKKIQIKRSPSKKLSSSLLNYGAGLSGGRQGQSQQQAGPGRPRGDFKHRDPRTGQPIPATVYYKIRKDLQRQAQQRAKMTDLQAIQELAKRGIPPEQAKQIVDTRQLQSAGVQPQQIQQQLTPEQIRLLMMQRQAQQVNNGQVQAPPSNAVRPIWRRQDRVVLERDTFGRVKRKLSGNDPRNFWQ